MPKTVRETVEMVVEGWLKQNGFDGLYNPNAKCCCELGDLCPGSDMGRGCKPGYKVPVLNHEEDELDFNIVPEKRK